MEQLEQIHFLYRFSLRFFLDIFFSVLRQNPHLDNVKDPQERLEILIRYEWHIVCSLTIPGIYSTTSTEEYQEDFSMTTTLPLH